MGFEPLRETEQIAMFRLNQVATPARVTGFHPVGGKKQPTVEKNYLQHPGVGKPGTTSDVLDVYDPGSDNVD